MLHPVPRCADLASPTLCHGYAGLLAIAVEFVRAGASERAGAAVPVMAEDLAGHADPTRPVLFTDQDVPGNHVDDPSLLTGAAGVAMALLAEPSREPGALLPLMGR